MTLPLLNEWIAFSKRDRELRSEYRHIADDVKALHDQVNATYVKADQDKGAREYLTSVKLTTTISWEQRTVSDISWHNIFFARRECEAGLKACDVRHDKITFELMVLRLEWIQDVVRVYGDSVEMSFIPYISDTIMDSGPWCKVGADEYTQALVKE